MNAVAVCRYCEADVPHERCVESAEHRELDVPHEHHFQTEIVLDDPAYNVRDCACGHREHRRGTVVLEDGIIEGGSMANAIYVRGPEVGRAGVTWIDRWSQ